MRRWLPWIALALILWWVIQDPAGAAAAVHHIRTFFGDIGSGR